ncbi:MAG: VWA domain-containing protein, partial [Clostridiales bacterium]|nr:VWA domain-containing protein [Clostridiales bacterium]
MGSNLTEIVFILDRSGSMAGLESDVIGGFNSFIENQSKMDGRVIVTAVLFDHEYELLWNGIDARKARLTSNEYYVRGCTALLDAVGKTILDVERRLSMQPEEKRPGKVIFVITTDGLENASREFSYEKVKGLIKHQQERYGWEFVFLGANIDVAKEADSLGICRDDAYSFKASKAGVAKMYDTVCEA